MPDLHIIILAAGASRRFGSGKSKVLHPLAGWPILRHVLHTANALNPKAITLVTSDALKDHPETAEILKDFPQTSVCVQADAKGTADAVLTGTAHRQEEFSRTLVLLGDAPLLTPASLTNFLEKSENPFNTQHAHCAVLAMQQESPFGYGRCITDGDGFLTRIVEEKDCTPEEATTTLCNGGVLLLSDAALFLLQSIQPSGITGELYLTALPHMLAQENRRSVVFTCDADQLHGINTRQDLIIAERFLQECLRKRILDSGVTLRAPETVFLAADTEIGADSIIDPFVTFGLGVNLAAGTHVKSFSHLEHTTTEPNVTIGPMAHLHQGTYLEKGVRVGNFVEVVRSHLGAETKAKHLAYLGDTTTDKSVNIGAGTVTCNFDGQQKHKAHLKAGAFIGSNTSLVAPITVAENGLVAAGSTITQNVPKDQVAFGRARQVNKPRKRKA